MSNEAHSQWSLATVIAVIVVSMSACTVLTSPRACAASAASVTAALEPSAKADSGTNQ